MMQRTGVTIDVADNGSSNISRISAEMDKLTQSAGGIGKALDPGVLDDYLSKLNQIGQAYSNINDKMNRDGRKPNQMVGAVTGTFANAGNMASYASQGNIVGMASQANTGAGKVLEAAGGGGGAAIAIAALGAVLAGGNALSQSYEGRMAPAMSITGMMGKYSYDIDENTRQINEAMKETSDSVRRYGKTYEEGASSIQSYLKEGGSAAMAVGAAGASARYSRAYGADMGMASNFQGRAYRYGGGNDVLDVVNGLMRAQNLGPGQYDELLQGMEQIFTSALSSGISKEIAGIASTAAYFGQAGSTYRGGMGAGFLQQMDAAAQGATGLQRQEDIFLFRAASRLTGGNYVDTMKMLEGGFTGAGGVNLFKGFMGELSTFTGGGSENMIKQIVNTLGVSYTQAEDLLNLYKGGGREITAGSIRQSLGAGFAESTQSIFQANTEELKARIAEGAGEKAFQGKAAILSGVLSASDWAGNKIQEIRETHVSNMDVRNFNLDNDAVADQMRYLLINDPGRTYEENRASTMSFQNEYRKALEMIKKDPAMTTELLGPFIDAFKESYASNGINTEEMNEMLILLRQITEHTGNTANSLSGDQEIVIDPTAVSAAGQQYQRYTGAK